MLVGHIFHATAKRIAKVEDDYHDMMELKKRAEAADVAKSQVFQAASLLVESLFRLFYYVYLVLIEFLTFCSSLQLFPMRLGPQ